MAAVEGVGTTRHGDAETDVELLTSQTRLDLWPSLRPWSLDEELMMADCSSSGLRRYSTAADDELDMESWTSVGPTESSSSSLLVPLPSLEELSLELSLELSSELRFGFLSIKFSTELSTELSAEFSAELRAGAWFEDALGSVLGRTPLAPSVASTFEFSLTLPAVTALDDSLGSPPKADGVAPALTSGVG